MAINCYHKNEKVINEQNHDNIHEKEIQQNNYENLLVMKLCFGDCLTDLIDVRGVHHQQNIRAPNAFKCMVRYEQCIYLITEIVAHVSIYTLHKLC